MKEKLEKLRKEALGEIQKAENKEELEGIKKEYLGKRGEISEITEKITGLEPEERREIGRLVNETKQFLEEKIAKKSSEIRDTRYEIREPFDITIPGKKPKVGHLHPITKMRRYAERIFQRMGFETIEPRLIDDDYHVFESLNFPQGHPARDMWDTVWTQEGLIPITHTSAMQNRIFKTRKPPIRAIIPGKCFRHERTDPRHEHTFYQIEGVYVDKGITLADLIGTLKTFIWAFYGRKIKTKIQPSYFPFVEPGLEFLVECVICGGKGCSTCGGSGWLELVPCGPIHPQVLKEGGIDPEIYSGFAWGLGLDRLVMLKYGIGDIRLFHSGDLRFIRQF